MSFKTQRKNKKQSSKKIKKRTKKNIKKIRGGGNAEQNYEEFKKREKLEEKKLNWYCYNHEAEDLVEQKLSNYYPYSKTKLCTYDQNEKNSDYGTDCFTYTEIEEKVDNELEDDERREAFKNFNPNNNCKKKIYMKVTPPIRIGENTRKEYFRDNKINAEEVKKNEDEYDFGDYAWNSKPLQETSSLIDGGRRKSNRKNKRHTKKHYL